MPRSSLHVFMFPTKSEKDNSKNRTTFTSAMRHMLWDSSLGGALAFACFWRWGVTVTPFFNLKAEKSARNDVKVFYGKSEGGAYSYSVILKYVQGTFSLYQMQFLYGIMFFLSMCMFLHVYVCWRPSVLVKVSQRRTSRPWTNETGGIQPSTARYLRFGLPIWRGRISMTHILSIHRLPLSPHHHLFLIETKNVI